jgi:hypothetical protein
MYIIFEIKDQSKSYQFVFQLVTIHCRIGELKKRTWSLIQVYPP